MFTPERPRSSPTPARVPGSSSTMTMISSSMGQTYSSVGAFGSGDGAQCSPQDPEVQRQGPVLDVEEVVPDIIGERGLRPAADLPQPGHPRLHLQAVGDPIVVLLNL